MLPAGRAPARREGHQPPGGHPKAAGTPPSWAGGCRLQDGARTAAVPEPLSAPPADLRFPTFSPAPYRPIAASRKGGGAPGTPEPPFPAPPRRRGSPVPSRRGAGAVLTFQREAAAGVVLPGPGPHHPGDGSGQSCHRGGRPGLYPAGGRAGGEPRCRGVPAGRGWALPPGGGEGAAPRCPSGTAPHRERCGGRAGAASLCPVRRGAAERGREHLSAPAPARLRGGTAAIGRLRPARPRRPS